LRIGKINLRLRLLMYRTDFNNLANATVVTEYNGLYSNGNIFCKVIISEITAKVIIVEHI